MSEYKDLDKLGIPVNTGADTRKYSAIFKDLEDMLKKMKFNLENGDWNDLIRRHDQFKGLMRSLKPTEEEAFIAAHEEDINMIEAYFGPPLPWSGGMASDTRKTYPIPSIDSVDIGDYVGGVHSPGEWPEMNVWRVTAKKPSAWGTYLVITDEKGNIENVHSFTTVGVGWYYLGKTRPAEMDSRLPPMTTPYSRISDAPPPRFKLGDKVKIVGTNWGGEISFVGQYDTYSKQYRYRVLEPSGTRKWWNENSLMAADTDARQPAMPFKEGELVKGDIVFLKGEMYARYKVLECRDERGDMPVVLVEAQMPGMQILPTKRVPRSDILSIVECGRADTDARTRRWHTYQTRL